MSFDVTSSGIARCVRPVWKAIACLGAFTLAMASTSANAEAAAKPRIEKAAPAAPAGPLLAVVSLGAQRLSVYDKNGQVLTSRVSSGQTGYETPQGVFAIIERNREHFSNLYDDASMPNMQRITWSGVAMHAGRLPGYPASHGCIRLPHDVSERLFELTKLGTRVVVTDYDVAPVAIDHPRLFTIRSAEASATVADAAATLAKPVEGMSLPMMLGAAIVSPAHASIAPIGPDTFADRPTGTSRTAWAAELLSRAKKTEAVARTAKTTAAAAQKDADRAMAQMLSTERARSALAARIDALAVVVQRNQNGNVVAKAEAAKTAAELRLVELLAATDRLRAIEEQKRIEADRLTKLAEEAANAKSVAGTLARDANRRLKPVSVFVSRKTGRLYVRQGFEPLFDVPVDIRDQEAPIGTHVFTAFETNEAANVMRWSAVTAVGAVPDQADVAPRGRRAKQQLAQQISDPKLTAAAALDRIEIPEDVRQRIGELLIPGSSLIVSDQAISNETGKGTDFIILTR